jgi:hypothetical protein
MKNVVLLSFLLLLTTLVGAQGFSATPLTDFQPGQLYLNAFQGTLYEGSNSAPADHDSDGRSAAQRVQPLDARGNPSPFGKIVVVGIGMSNWTDELCDSRTQCISQSFLGTSVKDPEVNHKTLIIVDCAKPGQVADRWLDDHFLNYSYCKSQLQRQGVTEAQVQVVLYKNALENPSQPLKSNTVCTATSHVEACHYEHLVGVTARFLKTRYRNIQQMFLHSRIYAGYAKPHTLDPEPFAYEYGFATKWLIEAQIQQVRTGIVDDTAGRLDYASAPWIAWGPYFWASGATPRNDGLTWLPQDYSLSDMTHPSPSAVAKVSGMMVNFYLHSPFSTWYSANGH